MWLTNSTYESISAYTITRSQREFEDMAVVNGKLKNEVLVNMIVNWLSPFKERSLVVSMPNRHMSMINLCNYHYNTKAMLFCLCKLTGVVPLY